MWRSGLHMFGRLTVRVGLPLRSTWHNQGYRSFACNSSKPGSTSYTRTPKGEHGLPKAIHFKGFPQVRRLSSGDNSVERAIFGQFDYHDFSKTTDGVVNNLLRSINRFQSISQREDRSDVPLEAVQAHFHGKYITVHRGCNVMKCPEDLVLYTQVFWYVKPATIFEIGSYSGGATVWMADTLKGMGITDCQIYSLDIDLSLLDNRIKELKPPNVTFFEGDAHKIDETFSPAFLSSKPHPWIVIEDAHENFHGVLTHFHNHMQEGDYFIIDDTNPNVPDSCTMTAFGSNEFEFKSSGPPKLKALKKFLAEYEEYYAVDSFFTDFFGYNGTWNWHGYIRRMK